MSRFYGSISGTAKTIATRKGTTTSGIKGHIRGWNIGIKVHCQINENNEDICFVYMTDGSSERTSDKLIAVVTKKSYREYNWKAEGG